VKSLLLHVRNTPVLPHFSQLLTNNSPLLRSSISSLDELGSQVENLGGLSLALGDLVKVMLDFGLSQRSEALDISMMSDYQKTESDLPWDCALVLGPGEVESILLTWAGGCSSSWVMGWSLLAGTRLWKGKLISSGLMISGDLWGEVDLEGGGVTWGDVWGKGDSGWGGEEESWWRGTGVRGGVRISTSTSISGVLGGDCCSIWACSLATEDQEDDVRDQTWELRMMDLHLAKTSSLSFIASALVMWSLMLLLENPLPLRSLTLSEMICSNISTASNLVMCLEAWAINSKRFLENEGGAIAAGKKSCSLVTPHLSAMSSSWFCLLSNVLSCCLILLLMMCSGSIALR